VEIAVNMGIVIGVLGGYFYLNWFVATRLASFITGLFEKDDDDEVIGIDEDRGMGRSIWTPVTRGDQRFKYWFFLLILPVTILVNYRFWDDIWARLDWTATTLVGFAARFI
jgi:hypothetical protein